MEFIPGFLTVAADNSTLHFDDNYFGCEIPSPPLLTTPLASCEESLFLNPRTPSWSSGEVHVSPGFAAAAVDLEALWAVSVFVGGCLGAALVLTGVLWWREFCRKYRLQNVLLSRPYFHGRPLQDVCAPHRGKVQCAIMLDDQYPFDCIRCPSGHYVGRDALQRHIEFEAQKPLLVTGGKIKCPSCVHHYDDQSLAFFCGPEAFRAYNKMRHSQIHQEEKANVLADIEENARRKERAAERKIIQEAVRNQFTRGDGGFYGFKCPTCGFGPVDHMECDDLKAHHGEVKDYGIEIDNSCPMCFWFSKNKTDWGEWDGEFLEGDQLEATQKAVDEYKLPFEKFKEGALARLHELKSLLTVASVNNRLNMLQQIAPREFPETAKNVSYCDQAEDLYDIARQMRTTYSIHQRSRLSKHLIQSMACYRTKGLHSEFKYKALKKEQFDLVKELAEKREEMKDNIQDAVLALGYEIEVTHPPPESDDDF